MKKLIKEIGSDASKAFGGWTDKDLMRARLVLWSGAIIIGLVSAGFAVACHWASTVNSGLFQKHPLLPFLILPLGLVALRIVTKVISPAAPGSGIPQAMAAARLTSSEAKTKLLSLKIAISKFVLTFLGHLMGASIGREGPTVQIGSSILFHMGKYAKFEKADIERGLIVAGGAAGISAAFNTPLAGIVFAIEELSRKFEERMSHLTLITVVIAALVSMAIVGNNFYFGSAGITVPWDVATRAGVIIGIVCGISGGLFSRILIAIRSVMAQYNYMNTIWVTLLCGFVIASLGYMSEGFVYGTGYTQTFGMLAGETANVPFYFPIYKIIATMASYLSGIPGGIFAPSLSAGGSIGLVLADFTNIIGPAAVTLGMAAYLSGIVQSPITSFVIVAEMVDDQSMIVPLMVASLVAMLASKVVCPQPLYRTLSLIYVNRYEEEEKSRESTSLKQT